MHVIQWIQCACSVHVNVIAAGCACSMMCIRLVAQALFCGRKENCCGSIWLCIPGAHVVCCIPGVGQVPGSVSAKVGGTRALRVLCLARCSIGSAMSSWAGMPSRRHSNLYMNQRHHFRALTAQGIAGLSQMCRCRWATSRSGSRARYKKCEPWNDSSPIPMWCAELPNVACCKCASPSVPSHGLCPVPWALPRVQEPRV